MLPLVSPPAPGTVRVFQPNQVDQFQNLVVDEHGKPVFGLGDHGLPIDPFGKQFEAALFDDVTAAVHPSEPVPAAPGANMPRPVAGQAACMLVPGQVDEHGVTIVDERRAPLFGMDGSGNFALDSEGVPFERTRWEDVILAPVQDKGRFNAILVIDISRSMMARDLEVSGLSRTLESLKAVIGTPAIVQFLDQFKDGILIPRRLGAALAAMFFIAEKLARGLDEKIAVIRFADMAETLDFDGSAFMSGASSTREFVERMAETIIDTIANSYGQATSMGKALYLARELVDLMQRMEGGKDVANPVSCILLTDGYPTDGEGFEQVAMDLARDPLVTLHVAGLGTPNAELMQRVAAACRGEFFMTDTLDDLVDWYVSRARKIAGAGAT